MKTKRILFYLFAFSPLASILQLFLGMWFIQVNFPHDYNLTASLFVLNNLIAVSLLYVIPPIYSIVNIFRLLRTSQSQKARQVLYLLTISAAFIYITTTFSLTYISLSYRLNLDQTTLYLFYGSLLTLILLPFYILFYERKNSFQADIYKDIRNATLILILSMILAHYPIYLMTRSAVFDETRIERPF